MTVVVFDPASLGTDVDVGLDDLHGVWGLASGLRCLTNDLLARWTTEAGGLFYDDDYGHDLSGLINATLSPADVAREENYAAREAEKDERVESCAVTIDVDARDQFAAIRAQVKLMTGQVFDLVFSADQLNAFKLGGVSPTSAVAAAAAAAGAPVQLVVGPPGAPGPKGDKGDAGTSGTSQQSFDFDSGIDADNSGAEVLVQQKMVNFDALPGTITFDLVGLASSAAGTATFRIRRGGTSRVADGTVVATMTTGSATPVALDVQVSGANPGGKQLVKLTIQSSALGQDAQLEARTLTIR